MTRPVGLALPELDQECESCQGSGVVTTPAWLEWRQKELTMEAAYRAANPGCSWISSDEFDRLADEEPEPEMNCRGCGGKGSTPTEAGKALLRFLALHNGRWI